MHICVGKVDGPFRWPWLVGIKERVTGVRRILVCDATWPSKARLTRVKWVFLPFTESMRSLIYLVYLRLISFFRTARPLTDMEPIDHQSQNFLDRVFA
jgi:hypothetical protein